MKAVLKSISPERCELIASGKCTVLVCKTAPKLATPFKCYAYMTKNGNPALEIHNKDGNSYAVEKNYRMAGKVVGEFVCYGIGTIRNEGNGFRAGGVQSSEWHSVAQTLLPAACLTEKELKAYLGYDYGYCWHISELKIYDKPKELSEFTRFGYFPVGGCCGNSNCKNYINNGYYEPPQCAIDGCFIKGAPQSWCYVEV